MVRLPGARHSQTSDLLHPDAELAAAVVELRRVAGIGGLDPFTFTVGEPTSMVGGVAGATVRVTVSLGVAVLDRFPLDLSTGLELVAGLERHQLEPMVEIADVAALPEVSCIRCRTRSRTRSPPWWSGTDPGIGPRRGTATWWTWWTWS